MPEDEYFPLPRELREVLRSVAGALGAVAFAPPGRGTERASGRRTSGDSSPIG